MKKIAVINDLSGFGKCSLVASISVLSAMGVQACPLPTAILTAQTGYPSYYLNDCTGHMEHYRAEWQKMGRHFDGIYTGFVSGEEQIRQIFRFVDTFGSPDTFLLVDPVMGDNGKKYAMFTPGLLAKMRELAKRADIITPNLTELCLLTGNDYEHIKEIPDARRLTAAVREAALSFLDGGPSHIVVTGILFTDENGVRQMGNLHVTAASASLCSFPYVGESYSGTGDLFASCIAAGAARGMDLTSVIRTAGAFLEASIADAAREHVPRNDGVNYEKYLSMLISRNDKE